VVLETILGLTKRGDTLTPCPRVPSGWSGHAIEYRHGGTPHRIVVELTAADSDAAEVILDGPQIAGRPSRSSTTAVCTMSPSGSRAGRQAGR
jgi:cellobiose phosphorylase